MGSEHSGSLAQIQIRLRDDFMKFKLLTIPAVLIIAMSAFTGCGNESENDPADNSLKDIVDTFKPKKTVYTIRGAEYDYEKGKKLVYRYETEDDKLSRDLQKYINKQRSSPETTNWYHSRMGEIFLQSTDVTNRKHTYGYNIVLIKNGIEVEVNGSSFSANENRGYKTYEEDAEVRKEFEGCIMDYLRENTEPAEYPLNMSGDKGSIVFLTCYTNWAEDFQCEGSFIDSYGDFYMFDYSQIDGMKNNFSEDKLKAEIKKTYQSKEPIIRSVCDPETLRKIQSEDFGKINPKANKTSEFMGYDMGDSTLYVCDENFNMIGLESTGCDNKVLQDDTAKEIAEFYRSIFN